MDIGAMDFRGSHPSRVYRRRIKRSSWGVGILLAGLKVGQADD